jgi:hypothetical protein
MRSVASVLNATSGVLILIGATLNYLTSKRLRKEATALRETQQDMTRAINRFTDAIKRSLSQ